MARGNVKDKRVDVRVRIKNKILYNDFKTMHIKKYESLLNRFFLLFYLHSQKIKQSIYKKKNLI